MTFLEAICTKPMRGLIALHVWLEHVSKRTSIDGLKVIPLLLGIPCFHLVYLLFKIVYFAQERRFALLNQHGILPGGQHLVQQISELGFDLVSLLQIRNILQQAVLDRDQGLT